MLPQLVGGGAHGFVQLLSSGRRVVLLPPGDRLIGGGRVKSLLRRGALELAAGALGADRSLDRAERATHRGAAGVVPRQVESLPAGDVSGEPVLGVRESVLSVLDL